MGVDKYEAEGRIPIPNTTENSLTTVLVVEASSKKRRGVQDILILWMNYISYCAVFQSDSVEERTWVYGGVGNFGNFGVA